MKPLFDASQARASSTDTVRVNPNDAVSWSRELGPVRQGDRVVPVELGPGLLDRARPVVPWSLMPGSRSRSSSATQS